MTPPYTPVTPEERLCGCGCEATVTNGRRYLTSVHYDLARFLRKRLSRLRHYATSRHVEFDLGLEDVRSLLVEGGTVFPRKVLERLDPAGPFTRNNLSVQPWSESLPGVPIAELARPWRRADARDEASDRPTRTTRPRSATRAASPRSRPNEQARSQFGFADR
jgi:hypothetical protein